MTYYKRVQALSARATRLLNEGPDRAVVAGLRHARRLFVREAVLARPVVVVQLREVEDGLMFEAEVGSRAYRFGACDLAGARLVAREWARYALGGLNARVVVEVMR